MNRAKVLLFASLASVALAMSASAFAEGADDHGNGIGRGGAGVGSSNHTGTFHGAEAATRALLGALHTRLAITSSEEAAWQAFVAATVAEATDADVQNSHEASFTTAGDALNARASALRHQADDATAVAQTFATLYSQLTTTQRALVDQYFTHGGPL
jgi:hypothetical protein